MPILESADGQVAPVPVDIPSQAEGAPGPSRLGTGDPAKLNWRLTHFRQLHKRVGGP